jgi:hypothetical protein
MGEEIKKVELVADRFHSNQSPYLYTFKEPRNRYQGIDSASLRNVAWQAGASNRVFKPAHLEAIPGLLKRLTNTGSEPVFVNVYGAQESIPRYRFR